jgi:hypothetical protein
MHEQCVQQALAVIAPKVAITEGLLVSRNSADVIRSPLALLARGVFLLL